MTAAVVRVTELVQSTATIFGVASRHGRVDQPGNFAAVIFAGFATRIATGITTGITTASRCCTCVFAAAVASAGTVSAAACSACAAAGAVVAAAVAGRSTRSSRSTASARSATAVAARWLDGRTLTLVSVDIGAARTSDCRLATFGLAVFCTATTFAASTVIEQTGVYRCGQSEQRDSGTEHSDRIHS